MSFGLHAQALSFGLTDFPLLHDPAFACKADNRIKDAGTRRKQERVKNRLRKQVQPVDFP
jgi:prophage tail gpP-like protein